MAGRGDGAPNRRWVSVANLAELCKAAEPRKSVVMASDMGRSANVGPPLISVARDDSSNSVVAHTGGLAGGRAWVSAAKPASENRNSQHVGNQGMIAKWPRVAFWSAAVCLCVATGRVCDRDYRMLMPYPSIRALQPSLSRREIKRQSEKERQRERNENWFLGYLIAPPLALRRPVTVFAAAAVP